MKIQYVICPDQKKIFSWYRHDYKTHTTEKGEFCMFDGGASSCPEGYSRYGGSAKPESAEISEIIEDIRQDFQWGKNYDADNNRLPTTEYILLKNLSTDHIIAILKYFTEKLQAKQVMTDSWKIKHLIFLEELAFRFKNNILCREKIEKGCGGK